MAELTLVEAVNDALHCELARDENVMVRDDGVMLARYPPISRDVRLDEHSGFHRSIASDPSGGFYTSVGGNDNVERRVGTFT